MSKSSQAKRAKCFVIMPFGSHQITTPAGLLDFEAVFENFIREAASQVNVDATKANKMEHNGRITQKIVEGIWETSLAIGDISLHRPNVFLEIGIRQALRGSGTLLIALRGTEVPFDLKNDPVFYYDVAADASGNLRVTTPISDLADAIRARKNEEVAVTDSIVHQWLPGLSVSVRSDITRKRVAREWRFISADKTERVIGIRPINTIQDIKDIDIWVSSENRHMQMARFIDGTVSGMIRYLGSKREQSAVRNEVLEDTIQKELSEKVSKIIRARHTGKTLYEVGDATAVVTGSGSLLATNKVKRIIHVASVRAKPGAAGPQRPIDDIGLCVRNALAAANTIKWGRTEGAAESIVMPLFGTGNARGDLATTVRELVRAAYLYYRENPQATIRRMYFSARTDQEIDKLTLVLDSYAKDLTAPLAEEE